MARVQVVGIKTAAAPVVMVHHPDQADRVANPDETRNSPECGEFFIYWPLTLAATFLYFMHPKDGYIFDDKDTRVKINESSWDSVLRIFSGFFLLYVGLAGELTGASAILADLFGLFLLLSGVTGFCPVYTLFRRKK